MAENALDVLAREREEEEKKKKGAIATAPVAKPAAKAKGGKSS